MEIAGLYLFAYLLGAVPTAYIIGRLVKGIDIRRYGSGNVGTTNLVHHVGKAWAVLVCLTEALVKGAGPIWIGLYLLGLDRSSFLLVTTPLLAMVGNNWSPYLRFQGGRGVVVAVGTLLALSPVLLGAFVAVALPGWLITRSAGVWVLISLALLPLWALVSGAPQAVTWYCACLVALIVLKRVVSNWTPFPLDVPRRRVVFNRVFRDRDRDSRTDWVERAP